MVSRISTRTRDAKDGECVSVDAPNQTVETHELLKVSQCMRESAVTKEYVKSIEIISEWPDPEVNNVSMTG